MNIIDKIRIRANPNIIDTYEKNKINPEIVYYALSSGYKFNPETFERFMSYSDYTYFFKNNDEMINLVISKAKSENSISLLNRIFNKKEIKRFLINDKDLKSIFISHFSELERNYDTDDLIDILGEQSEEIELLFTMDNYLKNDRLKSIIINYKEPKQLQEKGLLSESIKKLYIESKNPKKTIQLIDCLSNVELLKYRDKIKDSLNDLPKMHSIINSVIQAYEKINCVIYQQKEQYKVIQYFIENVKYEKGKIPLFVLENNMYLSKTLVESPESIFEIKEQGVRTINLNEETKKIIANIIKERKIHLDTLPLEYKMDKSIFESAVSINKDLCKNIDNIMYISNFTEKMKDEEAIEYYRTLGIPFNRETVSQGISNFNFVLECLKNDYLTLKDTEHIYTMEEYEKIANIAKKYTPEQILESRFLRENPFLAEYILRNAQDLGNFDPEPIKKNPEIFNKIKPLLVDKGYSLEIMTKSKITLGKDGTVIIHNLESFQDIIDAIMYMQKKEMKGNLSIILNDTEGLKDRKIISENIETLRKYQEMLEKKENPLGISKIEFKYGRDEDKHLDNLNFTLKQMIENEERLEEIKNDILSRDFSPLEKYIAVYDFVKKFKPYKKENTNTASSAHSRALYEVIDNRNDCIVCVGYSNLMQRIGEDVGLDVEESAALQQWNHSIVRATLVDPKYGIVGAFTSDPTNDRGGYTKLINSTKDGYNENDFSKIEEERRKQLKIPPQVLIDAILNVKKSYSKDITEQDIIDLKMQYSTERPFSKNGKSCYGEESYYEYIQTTYEEIKNMNLEKIRKSRPMLNLNLITETKAKEKFNKVMNIDDKALNEKGIFVNKTQIVCYSEQNVQKVQKHEKILKDLGIKITPGKFITGNNNEVYIKLPEYMQNGDLTFEDYLEKIVEITHKIKVVLGLEKEEKSMKDLFKEAAESPQIFENIFKTEERVKKYNVQEEEINKNE